MQVLRVLLVLALAVLPAAGQAADPARKALRRLLDGVLFGHAVATGPTLLVPAYRSGPAGGAGIAGGPFSVPAVLRAEEVVQGDSLFLRVRNPGPVAIVLPAGAVFGSGSREVALKRGVVVPGEFSVLVPAHALHGTSTGEEQEFVGQLPPRGACALFDRDPAQGLAVACNDWRQSWGVGDVAALASVEGVRGARARLAALWSTLPKSVLDSACGVVVLYEAKVQAFYVCRSPRLFRQMLPSLLGGIAVNTAAREKRAKGDAVWLWGPDLARSRAEAFRRLVERAPAALVESFGAGFELEVRDPPAGVAGQVLLDEGLRGLLGTFFSITKHLPKAAGKAGRGGGVGGSGNGQPQPPVPPTESSPLQVDRKPRPSLAEGRQRDRKRQPGNPGGNKLGGGGGAGKLDGGGGGKLDGGNDGSGKSGGGASGGASGSS